MPRSEHGPPHGGAGRRFGIDLVALCLLVAVAAAVAAGFAWTRPTAVASSVPYQQTGQLSYSAPTSPSTIYGSAGLSTGQPIYTDVVGAVQVTYGYRLSSSAPTHLSGTEQLVASISNGQGITQTVPIQPPTTFTGARFSATGTLSVASLEAIAKTFAKAIGGVTFSSYNVDISPHVAIQGHLGSLPLDTHFDPSSAFVLNTTMLTPAAISAGTATGGAPVQQFRSTSTGSLVLPDARSNRLLGLPVPAVRFGSLALFAGAVLALLLLARPMLRDITSDDERVRLATRYGASLVEVQALPSLVKVELSSFTGLSQLARRLECPILHLESSGADIYAVVDSGTLYRYRIPAGVPASQNGHMPAHASLE